MLPAGHVFVTMLETIERYSVEVTPKLLMALSYSLFETKGLILGPGVTHSNTLLDMEHFWNEFLSRQDAAVVEAYEALLKEEAEEARDYDDTFEHVESACHSK